MGLSLQSQETKKGEKKVEMKVEKMPAVPAIPSTEGNVCYGKNERNVMDFWQAKSERPTPVVICMHGGSWIGGNKSQGGKGVILD
jgi:acetyl esterase/lipase